MVKITFIDDGGTARTVDAEPGATVMETAIKNDVPGIEAECGGACACATCHVYVDEEWRAKTGEPSPMEEDMLDFGYDVRPNRGCPARSRSALSSTASWSARRKAGLSPLLALRRTAGAKPRNFSSGLSSRAPDGAAALDKQLRQRRQRPIYRDDCHRQRPVRKLDR